MTRTCPWAELAHRLNARIPSLLRLTSTRRLLCLPRSLRLAPPTAGQGPCLTLQFISQPVLDDRVSACEPLHLAMKRKASDPVDLTADSDAGSSSADDSNRASTSKSTSKPNTKSKKKKVEAPRHLEVAQSMAKSEGLGPRSVLLGGTGTGQEHAGRLKVTRVDKDDEDQAAAPPPKPKRRTVHRETPNQILPFKVESKNNEGPAELIARLAYGEPHLHLLGRVKDGRGRRKKDQDSDSDEDDADKPFTIETLVGSDPDKHVQSAIWIAPKVQTPWLPKQFKTGHLAKARDENAGHESLSDGDVDATDDNKKKKKGKKVKQPQKVQGPTKKPLLIVQGKKPDADEQKNKTEIETVIHCPTSDTQQEPEKNEPLPMNVSFSMVRPSYCCHDRRPTWLHSVLRSFATLSPKKTICAVRSADPKPRLKLGRASSTRSGCRTCRGSLSPRRLLTRIRRTLTFRDRCSTSFAPTRSLFARPARRTRLPRMRLSSWSGIFAASTSAAPRTCVSSSLTPARMSAKTRSRKPAVSQVWPKPSPLSRRPAMAKGIGRSSIL